MMDKKGIKFRLSGRTAMFKKPDVNSYAYFTYNNIHKIALLGLLGAMIGLKGYTHQESDYPEFYEKLSDLKVSIVPKSDQGGIFLKKTKSTILSNTNRKGVFSKKIQAFNNSVGYASDEAGGNLIVKEQWLEDPCWDIYILDDSTKEYKRIKKNLLENKTEYIPYLGKNDHPAIIDNVKEVDLTKISSNFIDSLVVMDEVALGNKTKKAREVSFIFKEIVPIGMNKERNFYEFGQSYLTNLEYVGIVESSVYESEDCKLFFF